MAVQFILFNFANYFVSQIHAFEELTWFFCQLMWVSLFYYRKEKRKKKKKEYEWRILWLEILYSTHKAILKWKEGTTHCKSPVFFSVVEISNNIGVQCWLPVGGCEKLLRLANGLELNQSLFRSMEVLYTQVLANQGAVYTKIIIYCPLISFQILPLSFKLLAQGIVCLVTNWRLMVSFYKATIPYKEATHSKSKLHRKPVNTVTNGPKQVWPYKRLPIINNGFIYKKM